MKLANQVQRERALGAAAFSQRIAPAKPHFLPAPIRGLNAKDAITGMDPLDAIVLDNWYPGFGSCEVRGGSRLHGTVPNGTDVGTLATYGSSLYGEKMLAFCNGSIWDASTGVSATSLKGGLNSSYWQTVNMNDILGMVSGEDFPLTYDGNVIDQMNISGDGLDPFTVIGLNVFKSRSYFWTTNSQDFWYSEVNTLGGVLTLFPLADVGSFGGTIINMVTWSRDGGSGPDDLAVFIMSSGDVIVYQGSNPGSAEDWALVGLFRMGAPAGIRAATKIDGDVLIVTTDGYSLLSRTIPNSRGAPGVAVSDRIVNAAVGAVANSSGLNGWQVLLYPRGRRLMVNFPSGSGYQQHVCNMATGAWCRFTDMEARCWTLYRDKPYFGSANGEVYEADVGETDNGRIVRASARQAYNTLGNKIGNVHVSMVGPLMQGAGLIKVRFGLAVDYADDYQNETDVSLGQAQSVGAIWDAAEWDTALWSTPSKVVQGWFAHQATGYSVSPSFRVEQTEGNRISWNGARFVTQQAGVI